MRKRLWSPEEDEALKRFVERHGCGRWSQVARLSGLQERCPKSCRLRWVNYLRPGLKHGPFSALEIRLLLRLHTHLGNRWSKIAAYLPGRSDNDVKNAWHLCSRRVRRCSPKVLLTSNGIQRETQNEDVSLQQLSTPTYTILATTSPSTQSSKNFIMANWEDGQPPQGLHEVVWSFMKRSSL